MTLVATPAVAAASGPSSPAEQVTGRGTAYGAPQRATLLRPARRSGERRRPALREMREVPAADAVPPAPITAQEGMRRPKILARAARAGAALYRRDQHLRLALPGVPASAVAAREVVAKLAALEADLDAARRAGRPDYAPRRHVLVLSALFAETASALAGA